jgi:hypothetical protein
MGIIGYRWCNAGGWTENIIEKKKTDGRLSHETTSTMWNVIGNEGRKSRKTYDEKKQTSFIL